MRISIQTLRDMVAKEVNEKLVQDGCGGGQRYHDAQGKWSSKKNATSWSWDDTDCEEHGQYKVIGGKKTKDTSVCGRANRNKLCKEEETNQLYKTEKLELIIRQTIKDEIAKMKAALKRDTGSCTWQQLLNAMNKVDLARDGKLYAKDGK